MRGTLPIQMCDSEDGCTEYFIDQYESGASNWRELVPAGWLYDPQDPDGVLCPEHRPAEQSPAWRDNQGDIWTEGPDGLMHTGETAPFRRAYVEKKWGPLVLVEGGV